MRQLNTKFGLRAERVFLVWQEWTGDVVGEGQPEVRARVELLPTPRVSSMNAISRRPYAVGVFPEGTLMVDQISAGAYTKDVLRGLRIPPDSTIAPRADVGQALNPVGVELANDSKVDFWWEIVEDGRGDEVPSRSRYRVFGTPERKEGSLYWAVVLQRADESLNRMGLSQIGVNQSDTTGL